MTWVRHDGLDVRHYEHNYSSLEWQQSPLHYLISKQLTSLRRHLTGSQRLLDFPFLEELRDVGVTDYLAFLVRFTESDDVGDDAQGVVGSWTTDREEGFSDFEIKALQRIERRLAVACKITIKEQIAHNVSATYLGPEAGQQVLSGKIRRGDGETIRAVIWYSD